MSEFEGHYIEWRKSRFEGLEKYFDISLLKDKTLLELGCGYADIGIHFRNTYKSNVTVSDARKEHLDIVAQRDPSLKTILFDCDNDKLCVKYDVILHWGVLYHIANIDEHLKNICESCDYLLLESEVMDSTDEHEISYLNEVGYDQAFNTCGCRPAPAYVERLLKNNGFSFQRIDDEILNSSPHNYSWPTTNSKEKKNGLRRFWIAWRDSLDSPLLKSAQNNGL